MMARIEHGEKIEITTGRLAELLQVSPQTIASWAEKGCPKLDYGVFDLDQVLRWAGLVGDEARNEIEDINLRQQKLRAEAEYKKWKAAQEEIKLAELEQRYIPAEQVTKDLRQLFLSIKKALLSLGRQVSLEIAVVDQDAARQAEKVVNDAVQECLRQLSIDGKYKPKKTK